MKSRATRLGVLFLVLTLGGCATARNPHDPLEPFNRAMFSFNDAVDQAALKPAAIVYKSMLPSFVQTGIGNFFGNISDVWTAANNFLQGKVEEGVSDVMRVAVNSTMGFGGVLDIGSEAGLQKHKEDFGQTLGRWGVGAGPYVVLPIFGSSTVRDTVAFPIDFQGDPWSRTYPVSVRNVGSVVRLVDLRAVVLDASNLVEEAALDRYEFVRDGFLQRRESKVHDGESRGYKSDDDEAPAKPKDSETPAKPKGEKSSSLERDATVVDSIDLGKHTVPVTAEPGDAPLVQHEKNETQVVNTSLSAIAPMANSAED